MLGIDCIVYACRIFLYVTFCLFFRLGSCLAYTYLKIFTSFVNEDGLMVLKMCLFQILEIFRHSLVV
jgi:hypothetical protein